MWIITEHGFFTFVTDRKDPNYVWLRARVRADLEQNFPGVTVTEHPGSDYLYRAKVERTVLAARMSELVMESNITSHFKDVALAKAPAEGKADRRAAYYGLWSALAKLQPYAPYSRVPRSQEKTYWQNTSADRRPGEGQTSLQPYSYGGSAPSGARASSFDWDARDWGGTSSKDPVRFSSAPAPEATDAELDEFWASLTDEERDEILDAEETAQRHREEQEEELASAGRAFGIVAADVFPAPRNRPGNRRSRRKDRKRKNRHNQERTPAEQARFEQDRRDGKHGSEARNRQAFLDKHNGGQR